MFAPPKQLLYSSTVIPLSTKRATKSKREHGQRSLLPYPPPHSHLPLLPRHVERPARTPPPRFHSDTPELLNWFSLPLALCLKQSAASDNGHRLPPLYLLDTPPMLGALSHNSE